MQCWRVVGRDTRTDVRIRSYVSISTNGLGWGGLGPKDCAEEAKMVWSNYYMAPRYVIEEAEQASDLEMSAVIEDNEDPTNRTTRADLYALVDPGEILWSVDL